MTELLNNGVAVHVYSKNGKQTQDKILLETFTAFTKTCDKKINWCKVLKALNFWMNIPDHQVAQIQDIIEILHYANLLFEDVRDKGSITNGAPDLYCSSGFPTCAINAAHYATFIAVERIVKLDDSKKQLTAYSEETADIYRGYGMKTYWQNSFICPTEEEYFAMTKKRTAALFLLAVRLMQTYSRNTRDLTKFFEILSASCHIISDYNNIHSDDKENYCEDIVYGEFSFPIIHAIQSNPKDDQIIRILRKHTKDNVVLKYCLSLLEKYGSFEYTKEKLKQLRSEAMQELQRLGGNPHMEEVIEDLFRHVA